MVENRSLETEGIRRNIYAAKRMIGAIYSGMKKQRHDNIRSRV
jgi:hypothetical protein